MSNFRRLFGEHPGITLLLGFFWFLFTTAALIGPEDPRQLNVGLAFAMLMVPTILVSFAWANSKHYQQVEAARKRMMLAWSTAVSDFAVFAVLLAIPAVFAAALYGNYGTRASMSNMVASISSLRTQLSLEWQEQGNLNTIGKETQIGKPANADYAHLGPDGTIVLYNQRHGALAVVSPRREGNNMKWSCRGYPAEIFPKDCRGGAAK